MAEYILMLALSPTMETGVIAKWNKQEGDAIETGDIICEVETDKAVMEYESPGDGFLLKILIHEGGHAAVGEPIAVMGDEGEDVSELVAAAAVKQEGPVATTMTTAPVSQEPSPIPQEPIPVFMKEGRGKVRSTPLARNMAAQARLDLATVRGSGPGGRIVKRDIEIALSAPAVQPPVATAAGEETIRVTEKRRIIAERLSTSKFTAPHYYLTVTVEFDHLLEARRKLNASVKEKVSLNSFLIKLTAEALRRHPTVNSTWNGTTITQHARQDVALAVATEAGLVAPVVRGCGEKTIRSIDADLKTLIDKARSNKLGPDEYEESTFTISNLGAYGIEEFTAIINPPGAAILAVGATRKTPVIDENDQIVVRQCAKLTLSSDHRVIDGAAGASFLSELKEMIESPIRALF
jgi:pyruvate dehydrogenase E2 component (dihydrolipoamide acetyltransferase)